MGEAYPLSREKLCPILGFYTVRNLEEGVNVCQDILYFGGLGHTASIASQDPEAIREFSETVNAGRIIVNSPSAQGGIGDIYTRIHPSLTLGCGAGGQNITTDNVSVSNLINIKRVTKRMVNMKWFRVPPQIYFEAGAFDTFFTKEIKEMGVHRAFIVCSGSAIRQGATQKLENYLQQAGILTAVYSDITPDPTVETVVSGAEAMKKFGPDLIVAMGGGSPIDAAKAMWLFYENPDIRFDDLRMRFMDIRKRIVRFPELGRKARLIAIPTTSGTGSEVTSFSVVTDAKTGAKYPLADYAMTPHVAIVDPNLTLSVPPSVTADTGLDVLAHAIESYVSVLASDYTDPLALKAIQLVFEYLPQAFRNGGQPPRPREDAQCLHHRGHGLYQRLSRDQPLPGPHPGGDLPYPPRPGQRPGHDPRHPVQCRPAEEIRDLSEVPLPSSPGAVCGNRGGPEAPLRRRPRRAWRAS